MNDWKDRLSHEIHSRGLKVTKVSTALGFHRDYVSNVISGKAKPSTDKLSAICEEIGVSLSEILTGKPSNEIVSSDSVSREDLNKQALRGVQRLIKSGDFELE